jgi:RNA polymerase sigma factor (sigma-70 family)
MGEQMMLSLAPEKPGRTAYGNPSEVQLLTEARRGQPEAFEVLCQAVAPRLLKIALRITRNREDAEDAVQDSLMNAFVHINNFRGNSTFSTWLTRIVMNSALMIRRKNHHVRKLSADDLSREGEPKLHLQIPDRSQSPEQRYIDDERRTILRVAIGKLRPKMRAVVEIAQLQELPLRDAATVLDISAAAAKGRLLHARAALRKSVTLRPITRARTEPAA